MFRNRHFRAGFVLVWFWLWAFHVATGFLNDVINHAGGKNAGIIGALNNVTNALLVLPLGRGVSVTILLVIGVVFAALTFRLNSRKLES